MSKTRVLAAVGAAVVCAAAVAPLAPAIFDSQQHSAASFSSIDALSSRPAGSSQDTLSAGTNLWYMGAAKRIAEKNIRTTNAKQTYTVKSGDSLSAVAKLYHVKWKRLYCYNMKKIGADPNLLSVGTKLVIGSATCKLPVIPTPKQPAPNQPASAPAPGPVSPSGLSGVLGCSGLETLWVSAGGPASVEVTAASIAMAESGGNQYATEPTTHAAGYWQILGQVVPGDIYNPMVNAENAVKKYEDAGGFSPWTTYTSGAYAGRC